MNLPPPIATKFVPVNEPCSCGPPAHAAGSTSRERALCSTPSMARGAERRRPSARLIRRLDSDQMKWATPQIVNDAFADFKKLVDENPDDIMIRWMLAVQCRNWNRNAEGAELYRQILDRWNPGPVLVHQTYANLLDELARFEEALVEHYKAVKMEPAAWSYDGLGNTWTAWVATRKPARPMPWRRGWPRPRCRSGSTGPGDCWGRENITSRSKKRRTPPISNDGRSSCRCNDEAEDGRPAGRGVVGRKRQRISKPGPIRRRRTARCR